MPEPPARDLVDLGALAVHGAERFASVAAARRVTLQPSAGDRPVLVLAPPDWLDRLLSVLLDNACRYVDEGGRIELLTEERAGRARLVVDDSGPGISEAERAGVMRRFHRASTHPGGAGLGLSIADAIVRETDGDLHLASSPSGGTRVEVTWPAARTAGMQGIEGAVSYDLPAAASPEAMETDDELAGRTHSDQ